MSGHRLGYAQFVAGVAAQGVAFGQLDGDLFGQIAGQPARLIDTGQFLEFGIRCLCKLLLLAGKVGLLGIGLRTDRDVLTRRH